jgi:hypothetical protein
MESRKKSNDNYFGPKIKLFICVQAAAEAHIFLSRLPCQDVSRAGGEKNEKQRGKIYEEINCEKSPYGIFPVLRAVHDENAPTCLKPPESQITPPAFSLSLSPSLTITFPFIFLKKKQNRRSETCVENARGMRVKLKKFHPTITPAADHHLKPPPSFFSQK